MNTDLLYQLTNGGISILLLGVLSQHMFLLAAFALYLPPAVSCPAQCASIYDIAVHPDLQRLGLGSQLLRHLVQQVSRCQVYDIGLMTPFELRPFFRKCDFNIDAEGTTPMIAAKHGTVAPSAKLPAVFLDQARDSKQRHGDDGADTERFHHSTDGLASADGGIVGPADAVVADCGSSDAAHIEAVSVDQTSSGAEGTAAAIEVSASQTEQESAIPADGTSDSMETGSETWCTELLQAALHHINQDGLRSVLNGKLLASSASSSKGRTGIIRLK